MRFVVAIIAGPVAAALVLLGTAGAQQGTLLIATVGTNDGFDIVVSHPDGRRVTELAPGTYTIRVRDLSTQHNIRLASNTDPSVNFRTDLEFVGEQDFTVTFLDGHRYTYACEPHWQTMNGTFLVISAPAPPPPPPASLPTLRAAVGPTGKATLSARSVRAGRYRVVVRDRSARHNFRLAGRRVNRTTPVDFRGTVAWRVRLSRGVYRFGSDARKLPGRLRVR